MKKAPYYLLEVRDGDGALISSRKIDKGAEQPAQDRAARAAAVELMRDARAWADGEE